MGHIFDNLDHADKTITESESLRADVHEGDYIEKMQSLASLLRTEAVAIRDLVQEEQGGDYLGRLALAFTKVSEAIQELLRALFQNPGVDYPNWHKAETQLNLPSDVFQNLSDFVPHSDIITESLQETKEGSVPPESLVNYKEQLMRVTTVLENLADHTSNILTDERRESPSSQEQSEPIPTLVVAEPTNGEDSDTLQPATPLSGEENSELKPQEKLSEQPVEQRPEELEQKADRVEVIGAFGERATGAYILEQGNNTHLEQGTCGVVSQTMILNYFYGKASSAEDSFSENSMLNDAMDKGWFRKHGTPISDFGKLLEEHGCNVVRKESNLQELCEELKHGKQAQIMLNSGVLWGKPENVTPLADHAVWVSGVETIQHSDGTSDVSQVWVNDSGLGKSYAVPVHIFEDAWQRGRHFVAYIAPPANPSTTPVH